MKSRLYEGTVRHRRFSPKAHDFEYNIAMPYLRLDEIPALMSQSRFWSYRGKALGEFRRSDYLGNPGQPLDTEVRRRIFQETGKAHLGPIFLLANMRYFGHVMNPIACYYCYSEDESQLDYIVAEVNNTPWDERHSYVLKADPKGGFTRVQFDKVLHVSPFNPMDMQYHWRSNSPGDGLLVHLENHKEGVKVFDATLSMTASELTPVSLNKLLFGYPFLTVKIALAIYWQALKLFVKGLPVYAHPPEHPAKNSSSILEMPDAVMAEAVSDNVNDVIEKTRSK
jgi:uncharacterized protein